MTTATHNVHDITAADVDAGTHKGRIETTRYHADLDDDRDGFKSRTHSFAETGKYRAKGDEVKITSFANSLTDGVHHTVTIERYGAASRSVITSVTDWEQDYDHEGSDRVTIRVGNVTIETTKEEARALRRDLDRI